LTVTCSLKEAWMAAPSRNEQLRQKALRAIG
jgi:hypothetical protein